MARKPNYAFERNNRAKAKAAKREAKRQAKLAERAQKKDLVSAEEPEDASAESLGGMDSDDTRVDGTIPPETS